MPDGSSLWMAVVFYNPKGLTDTTANVYILDGGMLTSSDALGCPHNPLSHYAGEASAVPSFNGKD